jgi:predicted NAD/FAD-binding protein
MASLFSSSEYIDIVLMYGETLGVFLESREFPSYFLWGYMKDLVYSITTYTIEVLRKRVENAATTIHNNRGMLERVEESFRRRLHYCIGNNGGHFEHFL